MEEHAENSHEEFEPRKFLRSRRPELFSDSEIESSSQLTRDLLENCLLKITNRNQEADFERFCRKLCEQVVCPNLRPSTGPMGGGDSKVDSETYPVADQHSDLWVTYYDGVPREAASERWAFAFSAKAEWKPKCKSDAAKAAGTGRGYKKFFYVSNQYIKGSTKSKLEDELTELHGFQVVIFDIEWIIEEVQKHQLHKLVGETLRVEGLRYIESKRIGPLDAEREEELDKLEIQINDLERYKGVKYQLVEDCLLSAILARGLDRPRVDVEGRFERARRVAKEVNGQQQLLRIYYAEAWTSYWWFEDYAKLNDLYDFVENYADDTSLSSDIEMLSNLWNILISSVHAGKIEQQTAKLETRRQKLFDNLRRLEVQAERPSNALYARTLRIIVETTERMLGRESLAITFEELREVIGQADSAREFPVSLVTLYVKEIGQVIFDEPQFDKLLFELAEIEARREGDQKAGRIMLDRGFQLLNNSRPDESIKYFGRALQRLAAPESRRDWVRSILGNAFAYDQVGLLWAARANSALATDQALREFLQYGTLHRYSLIGLQHLVWLELCLGRPLWSLNWLMTADAVAGALEPDDPKRDSYLEERKVQDGVLAMSFGRVTLDDLKWLERFPDFLDNKGLFSAWMMLLYSLGHDKFLRDEGVIPESETDEDLLGFFELLMTQPIANNIPKKTELLITSNIELTTIVLGCKLVVFSENNNDSLFTSEMLLAAIESLLATFTDIGIAPFLPDLLIRVEAATLSETTLQWEKRNNGAIPFIVLRHSNELRRQMLADQKGFQEKFLELLLEIVFTFARPLNPEAFAKRIAFDEEAIGRAMFVCAQRTAIENTLGTEPNIRVDNYVNPDAKSFGLQRIVPWDNSIDMNEVFRKRNLDIDRISGTDNTQGFIPVRKHGDFVVLSVINMPVWDEAQWMAVMYFYGDGMIPCLSLGYKNIEAGKRIFEQWKSQIGDVDESERIRISIIRGIEKSNPHAYALLVSTNYPTDSKTSKFLLTAKTHRLYPENSTNLQLFLKSIDEHKEYGLFPSLLTTPESPNEPIWKLGIKKRSINVINAWEIKMGDHETLALRYDDDPVIPSGVESPPILETLEWLKKSRAH